jgi:hypothetical protein
MDAAPIQPFTPMQGTEQAGKQEEGAHQTVRKRSGDLARTPFFRESWK